MTDHYMRVFFDQDTLCMEPICAALEDAICRQQPMCGCEEWNGVYTDDAGYYHWHGEQKHRHKAGACGLVEWWSNGSLEEENGKQQKFDVGRFPVVEQWEGDYYSWTRVES